jgi:class 3 adenylate cyclase
MATKQRNLNVMFADVSGSAALFEKMGDTEAMHAVDRCLKRMGRSIDGYKGKTVQIVGDELLATFETPEEACQAAIDMQLRVADLPPVSGLKLTIRIGLHAGMVFDDGRKLSGDVITNTARIAGMARRHQILASKSLVSVLPEHCVITAKAATDVGAISENGIELGLFEIFWPKLGQHSLVSPESVMPTERLCVRYHGKAFLLDAKTTDLSLGRDLASKLVISDRKASRHHARIEKRGSQYFLVDTSTNGTFVTQGEAQEVMVRRHEMLLDGAGRICFGGSGNDPAVDSAEFEHL